DGGGGNPLPGSDDIGPGGECTERRVAFEALDRGDGACEGEADFVAVLCGCEPAIGSANMPRGVMDVDRGRRRVRVSRRQDGPTLTGVLTPRGDVLVGVRDDLAHGGLRAEARG